MSPLVYLLGFTASLAACIVFVVCCLCNWPALLRNEPFVHNLAVGAKLLSFTLLLNFLEDVAFGVRQNVLVQSLTVFSRLWWLPLLVLGSSSAAPAIQFALGGSLVTAFYCSLELLSAYLASRTPQHVAEREQTVQTRSPWAVVVTAPLAAVACFYAHALVVYFPLLHRCSTVQSATVRSAATTSAVSSVGRLCTSLTAPHLHVLRATAPPSRLGIANGLFSLADAEYSYCQLAPRDSAFADAADEFHTLLERAAMVAACLQLVHLSILLAKLVSDALLPPLRAQLDSLWSAIYWCAGTLASVASVPAVVYIVAPLLRRASTGASNQFVRTMLSFAHTEGVERTAVWCFEQCWRALCALVDEHTLVDWLQQTTCTVLRVIETEWW